MEHAVSPSLPLEELGCRRSQCPQNARASIALVPKKVSSWQSASETCRIRCCGELRRRMYSPSVRAGAHSIRRVMVVMGLTRTHSSLADSLVISTVWSCRRKQRGSAPCALHACARQASNDVPRTAHSHVFHASGLMRPRRQSGCRFSSTLDALNVTGVWTVFLPSSRLISPSPGRSMRSRAASLIRASDAFCCADSKARRRARRP